MAKKNVSRPHTEISRPMATGLLLVLLLVTFAGAVAAEDGRKVLARGAESYGPVTPIRTVALRELASVEPWQPGDPIKEVPRRFFPVPGAKAQEPAEGWPDPLAARLPDAGRAPTITVGVNIDGQGFSGATPPDTVGDVGPDHYVQAVNASLIAVYDKAGSMLPGYPIALDSLAPGGDACTSGSGDPIVLYDWLADRWLLQEFTAGGRLCIYVSTTPDPTGSYNFYGFDPPSFPDYPHYGVWPDAYYAATNENNASGPQTTYAFDRANMLAGSPATMQRLAVVPPVSGYGFQTLTPADHDGDAPPPAGAPGIFMRHNDDEAHGSPVPATDFLEMWEMDVDFVTPANTTVTTLPNVLITDFNSWMINYTTFFSTPQPGSGTLLDAIREAILQRLVYRNFGSHESLLGVFATNRNPATSGSAVEQGSRWFELRRSGGGWTLFDEGTFGGDTNSSTANYFMGSVSMNQQGDIALGYAKTDVGGSPVFPSVGFTGRLAVDPAGTMGPENDAVLGGAASSSGRYGDYANMSVDPDDDCTFWFTQEYIPAGGGSWGTSITSFVFEECLFGFILSPSPAELDVCAPTDPDPVFTVGVTSVGGWSFNVDLAASGEPPGTTSTFVPDNQLPNFVSTYTILGTGASTTGTYPINITGTGADGPPATERTTQVLLNLAVADPDAATLTSPADGAIGESLLPAFTWTAGTDATSYDLEVATDPAFTMIVYSVTGLTGLSHTPTSSLDPSTTYYWRVTANNVCDSITSGAFSFTTVFLTCEIFPSTDIPLLIPEDGSTAGPTTSTLTVNAADGGTIADVNILNLIGTHTFMGDLDFNLDSPAATPLRVLDRACGTAEDFDINLDDEAAPGAPPCPPTGGGTYQPANPLSAFSGEDSTGTWTLTINDNAGADSGQLDSWSLEICIESTDEIFTDGFESGDTTVWSSTTP